MTRKNQTKYSNFDEFLGDGFTPLHLVASRSEAHDGSNGPLIHLDEDTQVRFIFTVENSYFLHGWKRKHVFF